MSLTMRLEELRASRFARAAATLVGGTAASQGIVIAAMLILTRLYSPGDFKVTSVYLSLTAIVASIACLRFEIAIPLPESDEDAAHLLVMSLVFAGVTGLVVAIIFAVVPIGSVSPIAALGAGKWLVPFGIWTAASFTALQNWSTRFRRFGEVARARIVQSVSGVCVQLGLGLAGMGATGLMLGQTFFGGAGSLRFLRRILVTDRALLSRVTVAGARTQFSAYHRFPLYSTVEAFSNAVGIQGPIIAIAAFVAGPEAGFVFLAMRVMNTPLQIIGSAIGDVFLSGAAEQRRAGRLRAHTLSVLSVLAKLGIVPLVIVAFIAPAAFALVFGDKWRRAGELVQWMTPWFILQFLASPISTALHVSGKVHVATALQLTGLVLRLGSVFFAASVLGRYVAEAYAVSGAVFYALYLAVILVVAGRDEISKDVALTVSFDAAPL